MNTIIEKLLVPHDAESLAVTHELLILETSLGVRRFVDPNEVMPGNDIRLGFPELIGIEDCLTDILEGRQKSFKLEGIARVISPNLYFYIDLYITSLDGVLIILLEETTERMNLAQQLAQKNNQASLLLSALSTSNNYLDKIITSLKDALFVTTQSGQIIKTNQAAVDLFEYSQEELIDKPISRIITDNNILPEASHHNLLAQNDFLNNCSIVCQTKTGKKLTVTFCVSVVETEIKGL